MIWKLVAEKLTGVFLELEYLDAILTFGQGIITFAVFINDTAELLIPVTLFWKRLWYGADKLVLPNWFDVSEETRNVCEHFAKHHMNQCIKEIAKKKRWRIKVYKKVFYGNIFVDWLLEYGLANDRSDAVQLARHLIDGRVLRHVNRRYHFHDKKLLYKFEETIIKN